MKNNIFKTVGLFIFITWALLPQACKNEKWDDHYINEPSKATNIRLAEYIKTDTSLSKFYQMLTITGYDTVLNRAQNYTVWAPNNIALQNVDLNDLTLVGDIVKNHIAHFTISTAGVVSDTFLMVNGKLNIFSKSSSGYLFGNSSVIGSGVLAANGIVYVIDAFVPFPVNILEYIMRTEGLDSIRNYIREQTKLKFRPDLSIVIGYYGGNKIYDSVKVESNLLLDHIGNFNDEDSVYSVIVPDNTAWTEAYNRIAPYFVSNSSPKNQRAFTQFSIVRDMVFRGRIANPESHDSLMTTMGSKYYNPGFLFSNANASSVSNGMVYITNKMQFKDTISWHKEIRTEAEYTANRKIYNANVYERTNDGSSMVVSKNKYIQVEPTSPTSKASVEMSIPGTLSARYNIYCVFVPTYIVNPAEKKPFKVSFALMFYKNGIFDKLVNLPVTSNVTDTTHITKMKIASNYKFTQSDIRLDENGFPNLYNKVSNITLRVFNEATTSSADTKKYSRNMQIDCIIFEPIAE